MFKGKRTSFKLQLRLDILNYKTINIDISFKITTRSENVQCEVERNMVYQWIQILLKTNHRKFVVPTNK